MICLNRGCVRGVCGARASFELVRTRAAGGELHLEHPGGVVYELHRGSARREGRCLALSSSLLSETFPPPSGICGMIAASERRQEKSTQRTDPASILAVRVRVWWGRCTARGSQPSPAEGCMGPCSGLGDRYRTWGTAPGLARGPVVACGYCMLRGLFELKGSGSGVGHPRRLARSGP